MPLTESQLAEFHERGVVIAENILTEADLAPVIGAIESFIDRRANELHAEGKIQSRHAGEPFLTRFAHLYEQSKEIAHGIDIMHMRAKPIFDFLRNAALMDALESILGPEITCSPIQHLRAKTPERLNTRANNYHNVPWHQDSGVTWEEADANLIVTCWVPLVHATDARGCMRVLPAVHKGGHLQHQAEGGTTIVPTLLPDADPLIAEVKAGGAVLMSQFTPHCSTPNLTRHDVRWSMDLRYQKTGTHTGRPWLPNFIALSRSNPASVLTDYDLWCQKWDEGLAYQSANKPKAHRV